MSDYIKMDGGERPMSVIPKACANCRIRKIKCSRQFPCSSCEASGIQCQISSAKTQVRSAPARRPVVAGDKDDIKLLSQNIEEIRQSVQHLLTLSENRTSSSSPKSLPGPEVEQPGSSESPHSVFEGVSSFANQAIDAGEASQIFARDHAQLAAAQDGLRSLRDLVHTTSAGTTGGSPKESKRKVSKTATNMDLPPTDFVVQLLRVFKTEPSLSLLAYGFGTIADLEKLCQAAYFPTEPITLGQLATMHGIMVFLLREWSLRPGMPFPDHFDYAAIMSLCQKNFETAIKTYEVFANPTLDNTKALRIAATWGQDRTDVNTCWMNTSCGARHAISLGLHRKASYAGLTAEEANDRKRLFWSIYTHDKSVSLTLGQSPTIQDDDIDVEMFEASSDPKFAPWDRANQAFYNFAKIEGMIYSRLYTAAALRKTNEERLAIAAELEQSLKNWWQHYMPGEVPDCYGLEYFKTIYIVPTKVVWYSLISTIHRGTYATSASPGTITPACYQAACRSIECHLEALDHTRGFVNGEMVHVYLSWNLLYGTFTPIIVVFLHVISTFDGRDLELLLQFYNSLENLPDPSEGTIRFRNACAIFCSVAKAYVGTNAMVPSTAPVQTEAIVRREDIQQAFDPAQMTGYNNTGADSTLNWGQFDPSNLDGMYTFVDNWMDGTQQSIDFLNMDLSNM